MAIWVDNGRRPDCYGNFAHDGKGNPVGSCRSCQPWKKCEVWTRRQIRNAAIAAGENPKCYGHYGSEVPICDACPVEHECSRNKAEWMKDAQAQEERKQKKLEKSEEEKLVERVREKLRDQYGDATGTD